MGGRDSDLVMRPTYAQRGFGSSPGGFQGIVMQTSGEAEHVAPVDPNYDVEPCRMRLRDAPESGFG
jgi:hypothetical protein